MIAQKYLLPAIILALAVSVTPVEAFPEVAGCRAADAGSTGHQERMDPARHQAGIKGRVARIFRQLDIDGNDIITLDEFLAKSLENVSHRFDHIDTDHDELISWEEFSAVQHNLPDDLDSDALRACIAEHLETDIPDRPDRESRFNEIDSSGDGFIDLDEFTTARTAGVTDKFNRIDADADGAITKRELFEALNSMRERHKIRHDCIEEQWDITALLAE